MYTTTNMNRSSVIFVLTIILLNNFLQSDYMLDIVNRNVITPMGFELDLEKAEDKVILSTVHTFVLIVLVALGAVTQLKSVTNAVSKAANKLKKKN